MLIRVNSPKVGFLPPQSLKKEKFPLLGYMVCKCQVYKWGDVDFSKRKTGQTTCRGARLGVIAGKRNWSPDRTVPEARTLTGVFSCKLIHSLYGLRPFEWVFHDL